MNATPCAAQATKKGLIDALISLANTSSNESSRDEAVTSFRLAVGGCDYQSLRFPEKLHRLASCEELFPYIFWSDDGNSFIVHRRSFEKYVIGVFFDMTKIKSFKNNMSKYRFTCVTKAASKLHSAIGQADAWEYLAYSHPRFRKGQPDSSRAIQRASSSYRTPSQSNVAAHPYLAPPSDEDMIEIESILRAEVFGTTAGTGTNARANALDNHSASSIRDIFQHNLNHYSSSTCSTENNEPIGPMFARAAQNTHIPSIGSKDELDCASVCSSEEIESQFDHQMLL